MSRQRIVQPERQFRYTFGREHPPVATVRPGEIFEVETEDAANGEVRSTRDLPSRIIRYPYVNPQTGPILVEGAEPGDTLVVEILDIRPGRDYAWSWFAPFFGGLTGTTFTRTLQPALEERTYIFPLRDGAFQFNETIRIPWQPFYGTIGTAPFIEAVHTLTPGNHGGNMDCREVCPGNLVLLPVRVPGALLFVGDCHGNQGEGELCGTALEISSIGTLRVQLQKGYAIEWPRIVSRDRLMVVGSARPMEDAARIAYYELVQWLARDYGFDALDAYQLLTQVGELCVGNMVDTTYSLVAKISRHYLPPPRRRTLWASETVAGGAE